jgi:ferritin-like metal-binding protein YciE
LAEEADTISKLNAEPVIKDIAILSHIKKINHYEIAGYGCAVLYAKLLRDYDNMDILQATLDEEIETEEILSEIADDTLINEAAEEWEEEDKVL